MEHCCIELAQRLGRGNTYPKPAYISPEAWGQHGRHDWWFPGATGPGYYWIVELDEMEQVATPVGTMMQSKLQYQPMENCPFCGAKLAKKE